MAEKTPLYMDINNVYSGDEMGLPNRDFISEGVVGANDYLVSAGAGNTVNIAAGACWILGDTDTVNQPVYRVINDAVVNKGITPDPTNPRIVLIIGQITDATFSGATRAMVLTALHGTPAVSPVAPALPASAILLSTITVPAAAASSAAYTIVDSRTRAKVGGGQAQLSTSSVIYRKTTAKTVNTTIAETDLLNGEITIAAGVMGALGMIRGTVMMDILQNIGGVNWRFRIKLGATTIFDTGAAFAPAQSATRQFMNLEFKIQNLNATNSQESWFRIESPGGLPNALATPATLGLTAVPPSIYYASAVNASAVDTTIANLLQITVQHSGNSALQETKLYAGTFEVLQ